MIVRFVRALSATCLEYALYPLHVLQTYARVLEQEKRIADAMGAARAQMMERANSANKQESPL